MTTALIFLPVGGALVVWLLPLRPFAVASTAFLVALAEVALWIDTVARFDFDKPGLQLDEQQSWFSDLHVSYHVGFYGFSLWLVGMSVVVLAAATGYAFWAGRDRPRAYYGLMLMLTGALAFSVKTRGKNPEHAVFSPDGRWLFVSAEEADSVDVVDVAARSQIDSIKVGRRPRGIAFTPDGKRAYVACELDSTVFAIDVGSRQVVASIPASEFSNGVTMHPDGKHVFISNGRAATVSVIDTQTHQIVANVEVGRRPWNMAITPDGAKLYVANGRSNSVSVIDAQNYRKLRDIPVGEVPWGVVIR